MSLYACTACGAVNVGTPDDCPVCGQSAYEAVDEAEPYTCEECGESFTTAQGLASHSRVHSEDEDDDGGE